MSSTIVKNGVKQAFQILEGLGLNKTITFTAAQSRDYDMETGVVTETDSSQTFQGVIEEINVNPESEGVISNPKARAIIDITELGGIDFGQFDSFSFDDLSFKITDYVNNFYSVEMTGVQE